MRWIVLCPLVLTVALALAPKVAAGDLDSVMAEANLEKRSEKAWKNAGKALDEARAAFKKGDSAKEESALEEVSQSVDLCKTSLDDSGKNPRKNSKYFRRAEIGLRNLRRRLDTFNLEHPLNERAPIERVIKHVSGVREEILLSIMEKR